MQAKKRNNKRRGLVNTLAVTKLTAAAFQTIVAFKQISYRKDGVGIDEIMMRSRVSESKLEAYVEPEQLERFRRAIKWLWKLFYAVFALGFISVILMIWG